MKRQMWSAWPVALSPAFACKMSAMYHWASACVLLALHCIVLLQQYGTLAYRQWGFRQRKQQLNLRGIRPAAPRCLAIALVESETDIEDLRRLPMLLDWCNKIGLDQIIIYDPTGIVRRASHTVGLSVTATSSLPHETPLHEPGCKTGHRLHTSELQSTCCPGLAIGLLSREDSLSALVAAAQNCEPESNLPTNPQAVADQPESTAWLSSRLQHLQVSGAAMAEPDLMLVFGKAFTLAGYPPWAVRVTEIYHMGRLRSVTISSLQHTLQQYCSTAQRFGT